VALIRAPEIEGKNEEISLETTFTLSLAVNIDVFSSVFVCNLWFLLMVRVNVVSCRIKLWLVEHFFLVKIHSSVYFSHLTLSAFE